LDILGLSAALRQHFSEIAKQSSIRIRFTENLGRRRLDSSVATLLFRIAQEALTNAIKHGHAKKVELSLRAWKKAVRLSVRDNGKGFHVSRGAARQPSRIGLHAMNEMTVHAGGIFEVDSTPGKGTTVRAILPLETAAPARNAAAMPEGTAARENATGSPGQSSRPPKRTHP